MIQQGIDRSVELILIGAVFEFDCINVATLYD